jgi:uncharacterized protein (DUF58 family)
VRPTRGIAVALAGALVLHLLGRITGVGWLALASAALLSLPVAAVLLRPRLADLEVTCTPVRTRVGAAYEVELVVRNTGRRPSPPVRLSDPTPLLEPLVVAVPALAAGAQVTVRVARTAVARGWLAQAQVELSTTAPFGLVSTRAQLPVAGPLVVGPRAQHGRGLPAGASAAGGTAGGSVALAGVGTEVLGLRPWRPGDGGRAVHARTSARHGRPVVLERERDAGPSVVVLCAGPGRGPGWEGAVARSCALAEESLRQGRAPVLVANGLPAPGRPDPSGVVDWHARLDLAQVADAATCTEATRAAGQGGTVLLLVPDGAPADLVRAVRRTCAAARCDVVLLGGSS